MKKFLFSINVFLAINMNAQDCSDLFISEYIEGPGNNNAIEIFNPTNGTIDLIGYSINRYRDAASINPDVWPLSGTIAPGQAITVGNGQVDSVWVVSSTGSYWSLPVDSVFYAACDLHCSGIYPTPFYFNGDDAITLEMGGNTIDIFGKVGEDPGEAWTDDASAGFTDANGGTWWTKRKTLVRKASVKKGITMNPIVFNPTSEYDSLPDATYSGMGTHICDCAISSIKEQNDISYVLYPNPIMQGNTMQINSNHAIEKLEIINSLGEIVLITSNSMFTTNNLAKGIYSVNIIFSNKQLATNKLIVE